MLTIAVSASSSLSDLTVRIAFRALLGAKNSETLALNAVFLGFSLLRAQHGHQAHQGPFALDVLQPTGQELTETHHEFDDPEDRFDGLLAQRIGHPPGTGLESMRHARERGRLGRHLCRLAEAL